MRNHESFPTSEEGPVESGELGLESEAPQAERKEEEEIPGRITQADMTRYHELVETKEELRKVESKLPPAQEKEYWDLWKKREEEQERAIGPELSPVNLIRFPHVLDKSISFVEDWNGLSDEERMNRLIRAKELESMEPVSDDDREGVMAQLKEEMQEAEESAQELLEQRKSFRFLTKKENEDLKYNVSQHHGPEAQELRTLVRQERALILGPVNSREELVKSQTLAQEQLELMKVWKERSKKWSDKKRGKLADRTIDLLFKSRERM